MDIKALFGRTVKPRVSPVIVLSMTIADEQSECELQENEKELDVVSGLALLLDYASAKDERSQRLVTCRKICMRAGVPYLTAYCHFRKSLRSFRIDRICSISDPATGEVLGEGANYLSRFKPDEVADSPWMWGLNPRRRADLVALLSTLIFVARCDKDYHPLERDTLERILARFWLRLELPGDPDFRDIMDYADRLAPDGETFWLSIERLRAKPELKELLRRAMCEVVEADGVINPIEHYWVQQVEETLQE